MKVIFIFVLFATFLGHVFSTLQSDSDVIIAGFEPILLSSEASEFLKTDLLPKLSDVELCLDKTCTENELDDSINAVKRKYEDLPVDLAGISDRYEILLKILQKSYENPTDIKRLFPQEEYFSVPQENLNELLTLLTDVLKIERYDQIALLWTVSLLEDSKDAVTIVGDQFQDWIKILDFFVNALSDLTSVGESKQELAVDFVRTLLISIRMVDKQFLLKQANELKKVLVPYIQCTFTDDIEHTLKQELEMINSKIRSGNHKVDVEWSFVILALDAIAKGGNDECKTFDTVLDKLTPKSRPPIDEMLFPN